MKVVITESKPKEETPYPKLMKTDDGTIVLMYKEREGTVLNNGSISIREVGEYIDSWSMDCFTDFEGKLELTNK